MKKATAIGIVNNLQSEEYNTVEKLEAVVEVAAMPDQRDVKKAALVECLRFTLELLKATLETEPDAEEETPC